MVRKVKELQQSTALTVELCQGVGSLSKIRRGGVLLFPSNSLHHVSAPRLSRKMWKGQEKKRREETIKK